VGKASPGNIYIPPSQAGGKDFTDPIFTKTNLKDLRLLTDIRSQPKSLSDAGSIPTKRVPIFFKKFQSFPFKYQKVRD
jgi:hypothetical protein